MSSWNSTTLEVPGASSFVSLRRSGESPAYRSLPSFDTESELDLSEKLSNASTSTEDLHYELLEQTKLRQQGSTARRVRLALYALLATVSVTTFVVVPPTIRRLLFLNDGLHRLDQLSTSTNAPHIPEECKDTEFNEPGWVFHPTSSNSSQNAVQSAYLPSRRPLRMTESQKTISLACADQWISRGEVCETIKQGIIKISESEVDAAWTFVEPTKHWQAWKDHYANEKEEDGSKGLRAKNFRSHNQIQYSIRAVFQNLPFLGKGSLLAASMLASQPGTSSQSSCRVMQAPTWLDTKIATHPDSKLQLVPHYDIWRSSINDAQQWRETTLPTFNSRAIESQLSNLESSAETILYLNDDFYIGKELAPSDIASTLYGPVYRLASDQWLEGALGKSAERYNGESRERNAHFTIGLINDRFGARERNWLKHVAYTLSTPMLDEVSSIWANEMQQTAESRFRSRGVEASLPLLSTLYNIEKHREALLWSFFIARSDADGNGRYSYEERLDLREIIRSVRKADKLYFRMPNRPSTRNLKLHANNLIDAGLEAPKETDYKWSSSNGYPYIGNLHTLYPKLDGAKKEFCSMDIVKCFGSRDFFTLSEEDALGSEDLFKRMAFDHPSCGDCMVAALVTASGEQGLDAFLPPVKSALFKARHLQSRKAAEQIVPYIGGDARNWQAADYSLKTALGRGWKPRDFAVRLIQRYSYVLGESSFVFDRITDNVDKTEKLLLDIQRKKPAFVALNDRFADDASPANTAMVEALLSNFHEKSWPGKTAYEI